MKGTVDDECKSNCPGNTNPTSDDIPFELPDIPFP